MDRTELLDDLVRAFVGVRRDPYQSIRQAQLCDRGMSSNPATETEWRVAGKRDTEVDWNDVPDGAIDACDASLSFFTPESWRFYLPAYIRRSLFHFSAPRFDRDFLGSVIFALSLNDPMDGYKLERYKLLNSAQHQVVTHFLQLIESEALRLVEETNDFYSIYDDAKTALRSYWEAKRSDA